MLPHDKHTCTYPASVNVKYWINPDGKSKVLLSPESGRGKCSKVFTTSPAKHLLQVLLANESVPEVGGKSRGLALFLGRCAACTHYLRYPHYPHYLQYLHHLHYPHYLHPASRASAPVPRVSQSLHPSRPRTLLSRVTRPRHAAMVQYSIFTVTCSGAGPWQGPSTGSIDVLLITQAEKSCFIKSVLCARCSWSCSK